MNCSYKSSPHPIMCWYLQCLGVCFNLLMALNWRGCCNIKSRISSSTCLSKHQAFQARSHSKCRLFSFTFYFSRLMIFFYMWHWFLFHNLSHHCMHKHLFIFVYSTQKPVSNYNKNAAPIAVTVLVIMLTSNVIKFYMLMSLFRVFKDKENKIGKIKMIFTRN